MRERTKLIFSGIWALILTVVSVWLLSSFQDESYFSMVVLVWSFAWLSGLQLSSWIAWMVEYIEKNKLSIG